MNDENKKYTGLNSFKNEVDATKQHDVDAKINKMNDEILRMGNRYKSLLEEYTAYKEENDFIEQMELTSVSPIKIDPLTKTSSGEALALAVASDWHVLERVRREQVNGLNEYNRKIAQSSVQEFFQGVMAWVDIHRKGISIPRLGIGFLGDLITNMIHDDQKEDNEGTPQEEILFALDLISGGLNFLLAEGNFEEIILLCCDGNHGRDTKFIRHSNRVKHSHEWLLYQFLKMLYKDEPRIKFNIAEGYLLYADVFGKTIRLHHGDQVRYNGGVGGITIPMNKAISQWDKAKRADLDVFGHFHQFLNPTKFISNGSLLGYSPFGLSIKAAFERPSQTLAIIDKKRFLTSVNRIYVSER